MLIDRNGTSLAANVYAILGLLGAFGCATDSTAPSNEEIAAAASVEIALTTVPTSTQCIRITATNSAGAATVKSFAVTAGSSSASLQIGPLTPGNYTLTGDAFSVACSSIGTSAAPWVADAYPLPVQAGVTNTVNLTFRENNPISISANFLNNVKSIAVGAYSIEIGTSTGLLQSGYVIGSKTFTRATYSAFDASTTPGNAVVSLASTFYGYGACAVRADGTVWCWGYNYSGELGPNIAVGSTSATPVQVTGLSQAKVISAGYYHTCALATSSAGRGIHCWGTNASGQLGNGSTTNSSTPVLALAGEFGILSCGGFSTFAMARAGDFVRVWGNNSVGDLGIGTTTNSPYPTTIPGLIAQSISAGYQHACAVDLLGAVSCWGYNSYGQLGDGTGTNRVSPVVVPGITAAQVSVGAYHSCARTTAGKVYCWGFNNSGQMGDATTTNRLAPTETRLNGVVLNSLYSSPNSYTNCGVASTQDLYCWGANNYGLLGDGTTSSYYVPARIQLL